MKNFIKKYYSLLLAAVLLIASVSVGLLVFAEENVEINSDNFPDINFRNAVAYMYDTNGDGELSKSERNTETMIVSGIVEMYAFENGLDEDNLPINDLTGIEYFTELKSLRCSSVGNIETISISALDKLESLACNDLGLKSIDLSSNEALKTLYICSNDIDELDLSNNKALTKLHCYSNKSLTQLRLDELTELEELRCDDCSLTSLDLFSNTKLSFLNCSYNHITKLDLSSNTGLVSDGNSITEYNIGYQSASAYAKVIDGLIAVPFDLEEAKVVSSSLDIDETSAYTNGYFYTDDSSILQNGIDYSYDTGISDSAYLTVHLDIFENQHYYSLFDFDFSKNSALIQCPICRDNYSVDFCDCLNTKLGNKKYCEYLDSTGDGVINAKDYAKIVQIFKK